MTLLRNADFKASRETLIWPSQLRTPCELMQGLKERTRLRIIRSPLCSKIVLQTVGSFAYFLAHFLNETKVFNHDTFNRELKSIEKQNNLLIASDKHPPPSPKQRAPLLTLSNHISCIDDPVIWASLLPFSYYATQTDSVRWSPAAVEICFSKPWHSTFFSLGKTFPIIRGIGIKQPAMDFALALLRYNQWIHLFPEGRVMRDDNQRRISNRDRGYMFKWGISELILDYFHRLESRGLNRESLSEKLIKVLPFYHLGMDEILPVGKSYIPKYGKRITILIRPTVVEMNTKLLSQILNKQLIDIRVVKSKSNDDINRIKITNYLEEEMEKLSVVAEKLHEARKS